MPTLYKTTEELAESRNGGGNVATGDSWEQRKYAVYFTDRTANSMDARNALGVPAWGAALPGYTLYVSEKEAKPDPSDQTVWHVDVTYRTPSVNRNFVNNGTGHKWNILKSISTIPVEIAIQKDVNGLVIANVLGEAIDPPITRVVHDWQVNVSFSTNLVDQANIKTCLGCVNSSDVFLTIGGTSFDFPTGTFKFDAAPVQEIYDIDGNLIANFEYQFVWRQDGWAEKRPNLSHNKLILIGGVAKVARITDAFQLQPVSEPQYLDALGSPIPAGGSITLNSWTVNKTANFDGLLTEIA